MSPWATNKDRDEKRTAVKKRRATDKIAKMKAGMLQNKRAKVAGLTYQSGIANESTTATVTDLQPDDESDVDDTEFDAFNSIDTTC